MEEKTLTDIFEEAIYSQGWSILDKNVDEIVKLMHDAYELGSISQPTLPNGEKAIQGEESEIHMHLIEVERAAIRTILKDYTEYFIYQMGKRNNHIDKDYAQFVLDDFLKDTSRK